MDADGLSSTPGGPTLGAVALRSPRDHVSLARRTRLAGEELGLLPRDVRRMSTATYEAARLLASAERVEAEIRLADGPALEVLFRAHEPRADTRVELVRRVDAAAPSLRHLVHALGVEPLPDGVAIALSAKFAIGTTRPVPELPAQLPEPEETHPSAETLRERYTALQQAYRDLQAELQETNSGVVAVYAELDSQADRLRQAEDRLRLLLDSVHDYAICMLSPLGEVTSWNAGAERLFGYSADEIIGRGFSCFYTPGEREAEVPEAHLRDAQERGRCEGECVRVRKGGSAFDAHVVLTSVRRNRELRGFSLVVRDVTERKRLEDDLRRRAEDLAAANRAKEDFLATLSHELRTPLNAMLGWTRLLRMGKLDAASAARALETIERNAHVQEQLIADILDVSRIVTGKLRLELAPMELGPMVEAALDSVRPAAAAKGLELVSRVDFTGTVLGDPDRLQQVLWNLLANAVKFTPSGGQVTVAAGQAGPSAVITVADTGEGIDADLLPFIFDRFRQGDGSVTRPHGGLGLGLSIVRHIVELHGGKVRAASEGRGRGATFTVHLPVRAARSQPAPVASRVDEDGEAEERRIG